MSCGQRIKLKEFPAVLERDIARLSALWSEGVRRFGGPFLAGPAFTAVDAFYAPMAFRVQSYGLAVDPESGAYVDLLLGTRAMREWYDDALGETLRDQRHDQEVEQIGTVTEDLRAS